MLLEYKRLSSDNPVDYTLFLLREPRLFIQAKALGVHLDDHKRLRLAYATVPRRHSVLPAGQHDAQVGALCGSALSNVRAEAEKRFCSMRWSGRVPLPSSSSPKTRELTLCGIEATLRLHQVWSM